MNDTLARASVTSVHPHTRTDLVSVEGIHMRKNPAGAMAFWALRHRLLLIFGCLWFSAYKPNTSRPTQVMLPLFYRPYTTASQHIGPSLHSAVTARTPAATIRVGAASY